MKKLYDLAVKTGEYQDRQGITKAKWENIGSVMEGDNGPFIFLKKTFNPAGIDSQGRSDILVSMFKPKTKDVIDGEIVNSAPPMIDNNPFDDSDVPF